MQKLQLIEEIYETADTNLYRLGELLRLLPEGSAESIRLGAIYRTQSTHLQTLREYRDTLKDELRRQLESVGQSTS